MKHLFYAQGSLPASTWPYKVPSFVGESNPPQFCKDLKYHTIDNLELQPCGYKALMWEDKFLSLGEIC